MILMKYKVLMGSLTFILVLTTTLFASWLLLEDRIIQYFAYVKVDPLEFIANYEEASDVAEFDFTIINELGLSGIMPYIDADVAPIGEIIIPSVDIHLPIFHGVSEPHLSLGAATLTPHQQMGQGNYSLASHYMPWDGMLFGTLHEVQMGDLIVLRDDTYLYLFEAISNEVISPYLIEIIEEVRGETFITLITCTPDGNERVAVQGQFIEKVLIEDLTPDQVIQGVEVMPLLELEADQFPWLEVIGAMVGSIMIAIVMTWFVNKKN